MDEQDRDILFDIRNSVIRLEQDVLEYLIVGRSIHDVTLSDLQKELEAIAETIKHHRKARGV